MQPKHFGRSAFLVILVALQFLVLFPFRFVDELGERDSYRMFLGLIDTVKTGSHLNSSLLYNREASFGYYEFLYALTPISGNGPLALISTMNWLGLMSVTLFIIPMYIVVNRLFGRWIANASTLILIATPVWWHCGLYGHPITTSLLLFFSGLSILSSYSQLPPLKIRLTAVALFSAALMFRFDVVLLDVALAALIWELRELPLRETVKETLLYVVGPLCCFGAAKHFLPPIQHGDAPLSILGLLLRFENPEHLGPGVRDSVISLGKGFTPILLMSIPLSAWLLLKRNHYPKFLFVSGVIVTNLVFWLPNASPPRHYLPMVPALSVSAAMASEALCTTIPALMMFDGIVDGLVVAALVVGTSLALNYGRGHLGYFPSQFLDRLTIKAKIDDATRTALELVRLPRLETPVIVLCDSNLVIAEMEKLAPDTYAFFRNVRSGTISSGVHDVRQGGNRFIMVEQSWEETQVKAFDQSGEYETLPVLSAWYLPIHYTGTKRVLAAPRSQDGNK